MGKILVISFNDREEETVFHDIMGILEQHEFQTFKKLDYQPTITFGNYVLEPQELSVKKNNVLLDFSYREFSLLYLLASNKGVVFKYHYLYETLWEEHYMHETTSSITALVSHVRAKIEQDSRHPQYILTVRGIGYRFNPAY